MRCLARFVRCLVRFLPCCVLLLALVSGMAVGIGRIIDGHQTYVAGAPRKMNNFGQVSLFTQGSDRLERQFSFTGEQIASGFGYSLTVGDFNSDGSVLELFVVCCFMNGLFLAV